MRYNPRDCSTLVAPDKDLPANAVPPLSADVGVVGGVTARILCLMLFSSYFICLFEFSDTSCNVLVRKTFSNFLWICGNKNNSNFYLSLLLEGH